MWKHETRQHNADFFSLLFEQDEPKTVDFRASLRKGGDRQSSAFKPAQDDDPEAAAKGKMNNEGVLNWWTINNTLFQSLAAESARKAEERRQARIKKEREEQERCDMNRGA